MARPLRIEFPGALYHVTSRGDRREAIYEDDEDRQAFLSTLAEVVGRNNWVCHAYCLMSNHYHLVVETPDANLSKGMRQLNGIYTQASNRRHGRVGHLFQGRYKGILAKKESYLLELARYVVLNPVRAGMVEQAGEWPWSSYRAMVGEEPAPKWLATDALLAQFGSGRRRARERYRAFVAAGVAAESVWTGLRRQIYLGDEAFVEQSQAKAEVKGDELTIPQVQRRPPPPALSVIAARSAWRARRGDRGGVCHGCVQLPGDRRVFRPASGDHRPYRPEINGVRVIDLIAQAGNPLAAPARGTNLRRR